MGFSRKNLMKIVTIPFEGFYGSEYTAAIEDQVLEDAGEIGAEPDDQFEQVDWKTTYQSVAESYAREWIDRAGWEGAEFHSLWSPREYNFETDEISIKVPTEHLLPLMQVTATPDFQTWLKENYTSRDGFISFVDTNVSRWPDEFGQKEYTLILEYLSTENPDEVPDPDEIFDYLRSNGELGPIYEEK